MAHTNMDTLVMKLQILKIVFYYCCSMQNLSLSFLILLLHFKKHKVQQLSSLTEHCLKQAVVGAVWTVIFKLYY